MSHAEPDAEPIPGTPLTLTAGDGRPLAATVWRPAAPRGSVVVLGATAVRRHYYGRFAAAAAAAGLGALTVDYRGIGDSHTGSLRDDPATMLEWARLDAVAAYQAAIDLWPSAPPCLVGHSFGGQTPALAPELAGARAALLVAAQSGYFGHWRGLGRLRMRLTWTVLLPAVGGLFGYLPGFIGLGEDLPLGVARQWAQWCRHPRYAFGHVRDAESIAAEVRYPILCLSIDGDPFAPRAAVDWLASRYAGAALERRHLPRPGRGPSLGHFGFFRAGREALWAEALDWLEGCASGPLDAPFRGCT